MFSSIKTALKSIFEAEMSEGGRLSFLESVFTAQYGLIPGESYPCLSISFQSGDLSGNSPKVEFVGDFILSLEIITDDDMETAEETLEDYLWDEDGNGLIPVLLLNTGFTAGEQRYKLDMNPFELEQGIGSDNRYVIRARIPLTVTTWRTLS